MRLNILFCNSSFPPTVLNEQNGCFDNVKNMTNYETKGDDDNIDNEKNVPETNNKRYNRIFLERS